MCARDSTPTISEQQLKAYALSAHTTPPANVFPSPPSNSAMRLFIATLLAACCSLTATAQPDAAHAARADRILRSMMRDRNIPGLQVAVVKHGQIVFSRSYGTANLQTPVPVTAQTVFSINSITKSFTGVAVMQLVEEGKVDLSASVSTYLDDLPQSWRPVTVRQLLTHMSGLPNFVNNNGGYAEKLSDEASAWQWVQTQPLMFPPGERFSYCQTNYALLLKIVEKMRGTPFERSMKERVFDAAGMKSTGFGDSYDVIPNKTPSYRYQFRTAGSMGTLRTSVEEFGPLHRSASGMNSTAEDMARWILALQQGRLLKPSNLDTLWKPASFNNGKVGQWALGWTVMNAGTHAGRGMTGGGRAAFAIYPDDDVAVVLLTNLAGSSPEDFLDEIATCFSPTLPLSGVAALREAMEGTDFKGISAAAERLRRADPSIEFDEFRLNDWGYRLLKGGKPKEALEVMKLAVHLYPNSGNTYDSLAEAYALNDQKDLAILNYRRSLELDPNNKNAIAWLKKLQNDK